MSGTSKKQTHSSILPAVWFLVIALALAAVILAVLLPRVRAANEQKLQQDLAATSDSITPLIDAVSQKITEKAVEHYLSDATGENIDLNAIRESMDPEDAAQLDQILNGYASSGLLTEAVNSFTENGGDVSAVAEELASQVDPSDVEALTDLYEKYKDQL